jgi:hypothetical protein
MKHRRYVFIPEINTYSLSNNIEYAVINFCPFCGSCLKNATYDISNHIEFTIVNEIHKWRNTPKTNGPNCLDCYEPISRLLSLMYCNGNCNFGSDCLGNIFEGANFITVEKIFKAINKRELSIDCVSERISEFNKNCISYFVTKFNDKISFLHSDFIELASVINEVLWIYHNNREVL